MATSLSVHNLREGGWRTVLSISGISIAVTLIFMQLGFLGAVLDTAVLFYDNLKFDLVARSPDYYHFCDANKVSRDHLARIENASGVDAVQRYHISLGKWNYAPESVQRGILIMGVNPQGQTFATPRSGTTLPDLQQIESPQGILIDRKSRPQFLGARNKTRFNESNIGIEVELNQKRCELAGLFEIGTGLAANGAAVVHEDTFDKIVPNYSNQDATLGLIQLSPAAGADPSAARDQIVCDLGYENSKFPPPIEILTRQQVVDREVAHWVGNTPIGFIFIAGVGIALIVGAIVVYIVLSADINKQIGEYATLKAMGYKNSYLSRVVLEQAVILGVISYLVAFAISCVLYQVVGQAANLPITMTVFRQVFVFAATIAMCCLAGSIAMQKLRRADPADLF
jgi:putative ABC transport system permease protein